MKKHITLNPIVFVMAFALCSRASFAIQDTIPAPPNVNTIDQFGVNVATMQVTASQDTVSIGGGMGLSHSISGYTNNFSFSGWYGYHDKYAGGASYITISNPSVTNGFEYENVKYTIFNVMRVFGPEGGEDFKVLVNGQVDPYATDITSNFAYETMGDTRNTLELSSDQNYLIWTKADGTELHYLRASGQPRKASTAGSLRKIVYPNEFTISIQSATGVTTNTGFQLKYDYVTDTRGLSSEKQAIKATLPSTAQIDTVSPESWSGRNPKYIRGINNAIDYCTPDQSAPCNLQNEWPTATFTWPGGMPQAIFLGESKFSVQDSKGSTTDYHYTAQDVMLIDVNDPDGAIATGGPWYRGEKWSPRLTRIKTAISHTIDRTYKYKNTFETMASENGYDTYWTIDNYAGKIVSATSPVGNASYTSSLANQGGDLRRTGGTRSVMAETNTRFPGTLREIRAFKQGSYQFESGFRNFVTSHVPLAGAAKGYHYDARGNLERVEIKDYSVTMQFPTSCSAATRKTCNKPLWVKDARGKQTDYSYHQPSGQVETVTGPPDGSGIRPQTRYTYQQLYAYYKKNSNNVVQADSPIWMKTKESYCRTTSASEDGCSGGASDEVITQFYYGPQDGSPNNLFLRSVSVTAQGDDGIETRTTCYQYDIYGNRIGEIEPEDFSGSCPE